MKRKLFFLPLFVALSFAGCSDKEDVRNGGGETDECGYVAVNIVQPKSIGSRAASDNFEYGTTGENEASTGLFFIFNTDGTTKYGQAQEIALTGTGTGNSPEVERIYNTVLVIDGVKDKPTEAKQIVCVLNAPAGLSSASTLSELQGMIDDYATGRTENGKFIMTNSVYKNGDVVLGAIVTPDKIVKSAAEAYEKPVDVYVERVVAKVRAKTAAEFGNGGAKPVVNGTETPLTIKVTGIEIANIAQKSYLFKSISGIAYDWAWDVTNKRSYWETVPSTTGANPLTFGNKSYSAIANDAAFDISGVDLKEYIQPNTFDDQKTAILVTAQLLDSEGQPADLAYIRNGYTTKDGAKNVVAQYLYQSKGYYKKVTEGDVTKYVPLSAGDLVWKNNGDGLSVDGLESYEVIAQVDPDKVANIYLQNGDEVADGVNVINTHLASNDNDAKKFRARVFTDGKCYYFVNIDQTPVAEDNGFVQPDPAVKFEGVIRNHIYDLTLNSIKGIGTPVFDPDDVIIPEKPEDEQLWYLSARINVLAWRLVSQQIDFE